MNTNFSITVHDWLHKSVALLSEAGIETARLDCLVLLEDKLGVDRAYLIAHPEKELDMNTVVELNRLVHRRVLHEPLAYIRNKAEFYGRDYFVDASVLVPRPESETIIEELVKLPLPKEPIIADIGTGSGILGITAALEIPGSSVDLYDISESALKISELNSKNHTNGKTRHLKSDLLKGVKRPPHVMLVNLPYVPTEMEVDRAVRYEPDIALYAKKSGMLIYEEFWKQVNNLRSSAYIITESLPDQHDAMQEAAATVGYGLMTSNDFIQVFRPLV